MRHAIVIILLILIIFLGFIVFLKSNAIGSFEGFNCTWKNKSGLIQEGDCCNTDDDCLIKYHCVKHKRGKGDSSFTCDPSAHRATTYGTCQRPNGTIDQCRSIGWNSSHNNVCID